jgi:ribonucleotide reductase alpha subunit
MFQPTGFSLEIFKDRYAFTPEETWNEACARVARQMAIAELPSKQKIYEDKFYDILSNNLFVPGGRIWYNSGRNNPQLLNCFVLGNQLDSKEGWGNLAKEMIVTSMTGGGCGIEFSDVRPRGASISDQKGECPGPVELMKLIDSCAKPVRAGGQRRVALMFSLDLDHPDVVEFLDAKLEKGQLTHANVSVRSKRTKQFIKAVKEDGDWELSWKGKHKKTIKAKELWNKIVTNAYNSAEPGFLNWEMVENESNISYIEDLVTTNPCSVGETYVAVADGRDHVTFKQLTEEGKDVAVYCLDSKGDVVIRTMRNPRVTGYNKEIFKVLLDDGSSVRVTNNHKFRLKSGNYKRCDELIPGDSLSILGKRQEYNGNNPYWKLQCNDKAISEHRFIAEYNSGIALTAEYDVHHKDHNSLNNSPNNLEILPKGEHTREHSDQSIGELNGRWSGYSNDEIYQHIIDLTKSLGRRVVTDDWVQYAKERQLPQQFSKYRQNTLGNLSNLFEAAADELEIETVKTKALVDPRSKTLFRDLLKEGYNLETVTGSIIVLKKCVVCEKDLRLPVTQRQVVYCSTTCVNKNRSKEEYAKTTKTRLKTIKAKHEILKLEQVKIYKYLKETNKKTPLKKEWVKECKHRGISPEICRASSPFTTWDDLVFAAETYNHKVISVTFDGYADVYNGTVDEFHNFFIGGFESTTRTGNKKYCYINNLNCGEIALSSYDCCCLGHLVLPRFVDQDDLNWAKLGDTIRTSVRFLDNVLTVNNYPLPEMKEKSQKLRRIGLGTTGLADVLTMLGLKYGSEEGNKFVDKLYRFISKQAYEASVMLAIEKGAFPACNPTKHLESSFMKRMPAKIKSLVAEHGIRNCAILTQAPTGTVSILSGNCSSGIEPAYSCAYERRFWKNNERQVELVFHPLFEQFMKEGKDVSHFVGSHDLTVKDHLEVQRIVQKHVDNAVSKTINMAQDYPLEDMEKLWLEYLPNLKGTTFYRENTRGYVDEQGVVQEPPLKAIPLQEAIARFTETHEVNAQQVDDCPSGICSI